MNKKMTALLIASSLMITACDQIPQSNQGYALPKGFAENGELLFKDYQCTQCHTVAGTEFAGGEWRPAENIGIAVHLGGKNSQVRTYGDLVTSIINPSHRIAKGYPRNQIINEGMVAGQDQSKMSVYNSIMTVDDLIDLVAFLESKYDLQDKHDTVYPVFVYPYSF